MKFNFLFFLLIVLFFSCSEKNKNIDMVIYPEYCGGCVSRNFSAIKNNDLNDKFNIYFDSTDLFILNESKLNKLDFNHIDNTDIRSKFGDYANIVILMLDGEAIELKTNETIEKGKHF